MTNELLLSLLDIDEGDYGDVSAKDFEELCCSRLRKHGTVEQQVRVSDRGDGRSGKIDIVFTYNGETIPIEIDRKSVRAKSRFKVLSYNPNNAFCITRSPFIISKLK